MTLLPPAAAGPSLLLGQECAAAALRHITLRAAEAAKAATLAREAAEEAEKSLVLHVQALMSLDSSSSSGPYALRVDLGSGVLARATPMKNKKTVILPIGLGFYLESSGDKGNDGESDNKSGESENKSGEALDLAAARVAALRDRAKRATARASRARAEAEGDARAALMR